MPYQDKFAIDAQIKPEILYDHDDMYGVVDDRTNPPENEDHTPTASMMEILGGMCVVCHENHEELLTIYCIGNSKQYTQRYLKTLFKRALVRGELPDKNFRILCCNCTIYMKKIESSLKHAEKSGQAGIPVANIK